MSGEGLGGLKERFLTQTANLSSPEPAKKPTIQKLNFSHEAIIRWLMENPEAKLGDCAKQFNYSASWLSIIVHSDAFQAKWREMTQQADSAVIADIPAKMRGAASVALEALGDQLQTASQDQTVAPRDFLLKSSEMLLRNLGYGGGGTKVVVNAQGNTQVNVSSDDLARARAKLTARRTNEEEPKLLSGPTPSAP